MTVQQVDQNKPRHGSLRLSVADRELLAQPLTFPFSKKVIRNRFCKAALSEYLALPEGSLDQPHLERFTRLYEAWAEGGSGLVLTGNIMVDRDMREGERNIVVTDERDLDMLKSWAESVQKHGSTIYAQLSHPGRQAHGCMTRHPVAPSAVQVTKSHPMLRFYEPRELTIPEIKTIAQSFITTSVVLYRAGFDGVQLHGAHGYLIAQFLNPRTNIRQDKYGGSLENRTRFLREIIEGIKAQTPETFSIGVKLNSVDFGRRRFQGQLQTVQSSGPVTLQGDEQDDLEEHLQEAVEIAVTLEKLGVDFIEVSGGSYESWAAGILDGKDVFNTDSAKSAKMKESTRQREAHFAVFAERISRALSVTKVILTGGFVSGSAMAESLKVNAEHQQDSTAGLPHIDMVGIGRAICQEPDLPNLIMSGEVTGALKMPAMPGGFFDDVLVCGGNIFRVANGYLPITSLLHIAVSQYHLAYSYRFTKFAAHAIKRALWLA